MTEELRHSRISLGIHVVVAMVAAWLSMLMPRAFYALILALALLMAAGYASERIVGKKGFKWWVGNGLIIYLFVWLAAWILLFNLGF